MMNIPATGKKPRVLLIAYQCEPDAGSVSMIGWRWVFYLARRASVFLVTHVRHRDRLGARLPEGVEVHYVDTEWFAAPLYHWSNKLFGRSQHVVFTLSNLDFLLFGHLALKFCRHLNQTSPFDVCLIPTPVTAAAAHRFGKIGPPTVLGPLNSGMVTPRGFPEIMKAERGWLYGLRFFGTLAARILGTHRHADIIFSAGEQTDHAIASRWRTKIIRLCENGVDAVAESVPAFPSSDRLELLFVGRMVAVKGLSMLLEAIARLPEKRLHLRIVGDGPERPFLEERIKQLGLQEIVEFCGYQAHARLGEFYRLCHVNMLPSIRESGGATILEALARGRPSIALDYGGPSQYLSDPCGFLIPCNNTQQVIGDLSRLLQTLVADHTLLTTMGQACLARARSFTWEAKIDHVLAVFRDLVSQREGV